MSEELSRQTRLAEVGTLGQARISALCADVGDAAGANEEALYLERAGVAQVRRSARAAPHFAHASTFHFQASRDIAAGAWRALGQIRRALGMSEP